MFCIECGNELGQVFIVHAVCVRHFGEVKEKEEEKKPPIPEILVFIISCLT